MKKNSMKKDRKLSEILMFEKANQISDMGKKQSLDKESSEKSSDKPRNSIKSFLYKYKFAIIAFLIPVVIMTIVFAIKQIYPFGSHIAAVVDMYHQGIWDRERALKEIKVYKAYDQICFVSQSALDKLLQFEAAYEVC